MGKLIALCGLLFVACVGRPLGKPCSQAADCGETESCVVNWWDGTSRIPSGNVCAVECTTDADCEGGTCATIGDGSTVRAEAILHACR